MIREIKVAQDLGGRAIDYTRQIITAEDSGAPVGSAPVESAMHNLQVAAVAFTVQMAISACDGDAEVLRELEKRLVTYLRRGVG